MRPLKSERSCSSVHSSLTGSFRFLREATEGVNEELTGVRAEWEAFAESEALALSTSSIAVSEGLVLASSASGMAESESGIVGVEAVEAARAPRRFLFFGGIFLL